MSRSGLADESYVPPSPTWKAELKLTPLDMNMPRLYAMRWILCFPVKKDEKEHIYKNLKVGLTQTIESVPWIAGNVSTDEAYRGRIRIIDPSSGVRFLSRDLTEVLPSYAELKRDHFPLSRLSTTQLSPVGVIPKPPFPVMAAQANFIDGGLLLTIVGHHSACDAKAFDFIIDTWASNTAIASGGIGKFSSYDQALNDRTPLMQGKPGARLANFPEYVFTPTPPQSTVDDTSHPPSPILFDVPPMTAHVFHFSPQSLAALKTTASAFSTNDALGALVWCHMTIARNPTTPPDEEESVMLYAANIRNRMCPPLPANYLGNASICGATERLKISSLLQPSGLTVASSAIRKSVTALNTPDRIALTIGLLNSRDDPSDFKFAYNGFLGPDISTTSWADIKIYESDWGVLGKAEVFRVPREGVDGFVALFPRLRDGGLEVMVGLENEAMERMVEDEEFGIYAQLWA